MDLNDIKTESAYLYRRNPGDQPTPVKVLAVGVGHGMGLSAKRDYVRVRFWDERKETWSGKDYTVHHRNIIGPWQGEGSGKMVMVKEREVKGEEMRMAMAVRDELREKWEKMLAATEGEPKWKAVTQGKGEVWSDGNIAELVATVEELRRENEKLKQELEELRNGALDSILDIL